MNRYIIISAIVHIVLIFGLLGNNQGGGTTGGAASPKAPVQIVVKEETKPTAPPKAKGPGPKASTKHVEACDKSFGGVGLYLTGQQDSGMVDRVVAGYPAYNAGIQAGDRFQVVGDVSLQGEIGTAVTVLIERSGEVFRLTLTRVKICYK